MSPEKLNKYLYVNKTPTWLVCSVYILGASTWIGIIYGYQKLVMIEPVFLLLIAPILGFLFIYHMLSYGIILCYKQFDIKKHEAFIATYSLKKLSSYPHKKFPSIDIFLPICGESTNVIQNTLLAVSRLDYPHIHVYVLDDKGLEEHKALALHFGFTYMSRENKGHMKKAGNIKHGYERSTGDFIIVYDADFAPHPTFIRELLPYMNDPKVAIIQSPQYFQTDTEVHKRSPLEYGAAHIQEDFYRYIQVARSRLGAPICCGSNAIYRRSALDTIGGTVQIEHSEDAYTGFELTNQGYVVKYIPLLLAIGLCPDDLHAFFHQQHRWCSGSLSLMLNKRFWISNLSVVQKLCFISGFMYYISHTIVLIFSFQVFFVLFYYHENLNIRNMIPFLPGILFSFVIIPMFRITRRRYGGFIAENACRFSYSHATALAFLKNSVGWQPTNTKRLDVSKAYKEVLSYAAIYFLIYINLVAFLAGNHAINIFNPNAYTLLFWIFYNTIATVLILIHFYILFYKIKKKQKTDGTLPKQSFTKWKLNTLGTYTAVLIITTSFGISTGNSIHEKSQDVRLAYTTQVQTQKTTPYYVATTSIKIFSFTKNVHEQDKEPDVKFLQKFLNNHSYILTYRGLGSPGNETDYFGTLTKRALIQFQIHNHISPTGYLGTDTRKSINSILRQEANMYDPQ